ncbi:hypothetical protein TNCV_1199801 [Trichonephila clavipes]|uniref:Uncharacterized protein n=1 Tax=Trichonephila clavipes TaxID=2585209 RepID=A0A8X6RYF2_TRICX|nr:hypothetical protein TNCV_1199801 [Trichonephila clavipes]
MGSKTRKENKCRNCVFVTAVVFLLVSVIKFNLSAVLLRKGKMSLHRNLLMALCSIGRLESGQTQETAIDAVGVAISIIVRVCHCRIDSKKQDMFDVIHGLSQQIMTDICSKQTEQPIRRRFKNRFFWQKVLKPISGLLVNGLYAYGPMMCIR